MRGLQQLKYLRKAVVGLKYLYLTKLWGMDLHPTARFSLSVKWDLTHPKGIHVGEKTYLAFDVAILTHDMTRGLFVDTRIEDHCFIGARSIILPGITVGHHSIVAAGSVVTKDVPPHCIVAGNPAQIIRENIEVREFGKYMNTDEVEAACKEKIAAQK
ncbi:MAG: acyltransferase [Rhodospirillales bacterium]|nr:acyltransferase [Rhodospirillales bacterium]MCB9980187.1 acyltransferase [Rhodospirillales bacterium]